MSEAYYQPRNIKIFWCECLKCGWVSEDQAYCEEDIEEPELCPKCESNKIEIKNDYFAEI